MIDTIMEKLKATENGLDANFIIDENSLITFMPEATQFQNNYTISELGKQLLQAAQDGNIEDIRKLLAKGAPFTADWLGTSPLHLAAMNNHLEACEIFLRAGICKDSRTKVDRTPLHMAAYEGHLGIVECLLKHGADPDSKDMLQMTPLHWAVQNGHTEIVTTLIRHCASTTIESKFSLQPLDIAQQLNRGDLMQIIKFTSCDPSAMKNLSDIDEVNEAVDPILNMNIENEETNSSCAEMPLETVMLETEPPQDFLQSQLHVQDETNEEQYVETEADVNTSYSESMKLLQQHGITMLPVDDSNILNSVMESGHSVVLTEAGKQALNSIKETEKLILPVPAASQTALVKAKPTVSHPIKKKKIITVTADQFLAMTSNSGSSLRIVNGKLVQSNKQSPVKRVVMKKNKVLPLQNIRAVHQSPQNNIQTRVEQVDSIELLMAQLTKAQSLVDTYKRKWLKSEIELQKYKQRCKILLDQNNLNRINI